MDTPTLAQVIEQTLNEKLDAQHVAVVDQSALHEGHAGSREGGGHFHVIVVSSRFRGLSRISAQRAVYAALEKLMERRIHALSMRTFTPEQWPI